MATTVLIVDDHPSFRAVARALLAAGGFEVVAEAEDGAGALAAARRLRPDCVLLDVQLPDMDGFAVAEALADEQDAPSVVVTSSRDGRDFCSLLEHSSACGFIPKENLSAAALRELLT